MKKLCLLLGASGFFIAASNQAQVPQLIHFQGRVTVDGVNFNGSGLFKFALVNGEGQLTYWSNDGSSVAGGEPAGDVPIQVIRGLYSVLLGDTALTNMTPIAPRVFTNGDVRLRTWFNDGTNGFQQLSPDSRIAAVGYAMMAASVSDGAITSAKLADGAVTAPKLAANAVTAANIAPATIGAAQLAANAAADNLRASGGLVLSDLPNATNLQSAGYVRIGQVTTDVDFWRQLSLSNPTPRSRHSAVWTGSELIVWGGLGDRNFPVNTGFRYNPATQTWNPMSTTGAPSPRSLHAAVWTGDRMIVWGGTTTSGAADLNSGGRYDPVSDTWQPVTLTNAPSARHGFSTVWTGNEWIIWGGVSGLNAVNSGARYNPGTDTWTALSVAGAPSARYDHSAVWSGREMIVWGGYFFTGNTTAPVNSGGRYDPVTDTWTATSAALAPTARGQHLAVWTGSEMIVWGGSTSTGLTTTGGRYHPATDAWLATPTSTSKVPAFTFATAAAWDGTDMIVWSGTGVVGGLYHPATNGWSSISTNNAPSLRSAFGSVWTGKEFIVWGGAAGSQPGITVPSLNSGARYSPVRDTWIATSGAPTGRTGHTAVWTGTEMIVWGGTPLPSVLSDGRSYLNTGGRFNPATGRWIPTSTWNAPSGRAGHTAVWTGSEMIIFGGRGPTAGSREPTVLPQNTGARYDPARDLWTPTETNGAPAPRLQHSAVWTGNEMIVWGGTSSTAQTPPSTALLDSGSRYVPALNAWISLSSSGVPAARCQHAAVWSGREMILWGGIGLSTNNIVLQLASGGRYDPALNAWKGISSSAAPQIAVGARAVFAGDSMILGFDTENEFGGSFARYRPDSDSWIPVSTTSALGTLRAMVWTGSELVVWDRLQISRYDPTRDAWVRRALPAGPPASRSGVTAVWTGNSMLLFGGSQTTTSGMALPDDVFGYFVTRPMYLYQKP